MRPVVHALLAAGVLALGCGTDETPETEPFGYAIDPAVGDGVPAERESDRGNRPLTAAADKDGVVSVFVANEVVLTGVTPAEVDAFVSRHRGVVIETDAIPDPPGHLDIQLSDADKAPTEYVVRVDPSDFSLDDFIGDSEAAGFEGDRAFASEIGARLSALIASELRNGVNASPNYVFFPDGEMLFSTQEHPQGTGFLNAFAVAQLRFDDTIAGNNSSVLQAWQFVSAHGIERRVNVAIIDGGFWLDNQGLPGSVLSSGVSDFHGSIAPDQYDFNGDDYLAGGPNPASCTGGTPCPWHGNNSASVAAAFPNNQYGSAGTGGWVSNPMMFKTDYTRAQVRRAVRTASAWGADVVSMSFGGDCNLDCIAYPGTAGFFILWEQNQGLVFVASAGNDNRNVDVKKVYPCLVPGVICVGSLNNNNNGRASFSNFGSGVDLFAPTNIASTPNPATMPALDSAGGTSASAPFVAGVAAMMKAIDPSLTSESTRTLLRDTAWQGSSSSLVTRRLNALDAVKATANQMLPKDPLEPNDLPSSAKTISSPAFTSPLTIYPDSDYFFFQLDDYATVDVDLIYMAGLGNVSTFFVNDGQTSAPSGLAVVPYDIGTLRRYDLLGPGSYSLGVGADALNLYQLSVRASAVALPADLFEINNSLPTAAPVATGSYPVTLHQDADVDYYAFSVATASPIGAYTFALGSADVGPLSLYLYKDGADVGPVGPTKVSLDELGAYVVRVTGAGRTRYSFKLGFELDPGLFVLAVPVEELWLIDPTSAVDRVLLGERDGLVLAPDASTLGRYQAIEIVGEGVNATLYDDRGNVVTEGTLVFSPDDGSFERIGFEDTSAGEIYVLVIERTEVLPDNALLPALDYALRWSVRL